MNRADRRILTRSGTPDLKGGLSDPTECRSKSLDPKVVTNYLLCQLLCTHERHRVLRMSWDSSHHVPSENGGVSLGCHDIHSLHDMQNIREWCAGTPRAAFARATSLGSSRACSGGMGSAEDSRTFWEGPRRPGADPVWVRPPGCTASGAGTRTAFVG